MNILTSIVSQHFSGKGDFQNPKINHPKNVDKSAPICYNAEKDDFETATE